MSEPEFIQRFRATGRNDDCPCGSGKKYKKCHLREDEAAEHKFMAEQAEARAAATAEEAETAESESESTGPADQKKAHKGEPKGGSPKPDGRGSRGANIHMRQQGRTGR